MATSQPQKSSNITLPIKNKKGKQARHNDRDSIVKQNEYGAFRSHNRRGNMDKDMAVSKSLSKLLRHAANDVGLKLDSEAYARVDEVLAWERLKSLNATFADIQKVVNNDAKQRYSMKLNQDLDRPESAESTDPSDWVIRANQGHSINIDSAKILIPITNEMDNISDKVVHGTYYCFYNSILETGGLSKMTRTHIHFCNGEQGSGQKVIPGIRKDAELFIYVDIRASLNDGILWWLSSNGVVLTSGNSEGLLPIKYFKKVVGKDDDIGILMENGVEVKKIPDSREFKLPFGKKHSAKNIKNVKISSKRWDTNLIPQSIISKELLQEF